MLLTTITSDDNVFYAKFSINTDSKGIVKLSCSIEHQESNTQIIYFGDVDADHLDHHIGDLPDKTYDLLMQIDQRYPPDTDDTLDDLYYDFVEGLWQKFSDKIDR